MTSLMNGSWVVIAAHNNAGVVRRVVKEAARLQVPVLVIDDGSEDGTDEEALAGGALMRRHAVSLGREATLQTGIDYAVSHGAQYIFTFDPTGNYSADALLAMADVQRTTGADIVLGSRWAGKIEQAPPMLKTALALTRLRDRIQVTDMDCCLRMFTRNAAIVVRNTWPRVGHSSRLLSQIAESGLKVAEAPVAMRSRNGNAQKTQELSGVVQNPVRSALRELMTMATGRR